jgi:hypothetical protein
MRKGRWSSVVSGVVLACSPASQISGPPGSPVAPARRHLVPIDQATWQVRAAFDSAARAGDTSGMAAVFAEDALLISLGGDSIRGRDAIAHYLVQLVPEAISADFSFGRDGALELCRGSARERLSYAAHINYASRTPDAVSGNLSVFWKRDSAGALKVAWAAFSEREIRRRLRRSECRLQEDSIWRAWRLSVSLFPAAAFATSGPWGSFERTLRARGWVAPEYPFGPPTPVTKSTSLLPSLVAIQYHLRGHVTVEILAGGISKGSTAGARFLSSMDYAQTRLSYSASFVGTLFSYERSGIQFGIGPAMQVAHWRLWDWYSRGGIASEVRWSRLPVGILGDARYHRLILSRLFLAIRAQVRQFRRMATPATPRFPSAMVDQGSSFVGFGLGVVF